MTLSFSGLKDGGEAESLKLRNLDDSKDSEEDNVPPVTVGDHNEYSSKEEKATVQGEQKKGLVVTFNTYDAKSEETSRMNLPKLREWSKDHP